MDPESIFNRHLLGDVTEPATADFYAAFDKACSRYRETAPDERNAVTAFADAANKARRAFAAADQNARTKAKRGIGGGGHLYTRSEMASLRTARKLMTTALDPATPVAEAQLAYEKMRSLLDPILTVPDMLDAGIAKALGPKVTRKALPA